MIFSIIVFSLFPAKISAQQGMAATIPVKGYVVLASLFSCTGYWRAE